MGHYSRPFSQPILVYCYNCHLAVCDLCSSFEHDHRPCCDQICSFNHSRLLRSFAWFVSDLSAIRLILWSYKGRNMVASSVWLELCLTHWGWVEWVITVGHSLNQYWYIVITATWLWKFRLWNCGILFIVSNSQQGKTTVISREWMQKGTRCVCATLCCLVFTFSFNMKPLGCSIFPTKNGDNCNKMNTITDANIERTFCFEIVRENLAYNTYLITSHWW